MLTWIMFAVWICSLQTESQSGEAEEEVDPSAADSLLLTATKRRWKWQDDCGGTEAVAASGSSCSRPGNISFHQGSSEFQEPVSSSLLGGGELYHSQTKTWITSHLAHLLPPSEPERKQFLLKSCGSSRVLERDVAVEFSLRLCSNVTQCFHPVQNIRRIWWQRWADCTWELNSYFWRILTLTLNSIKMFFSEFMASK